MEENKISVIMGVHNSEQYLKAAIDSIIAQTYKHWEFIICDDASNDNTWSILKEFESDNRFILIRHEINMGLPYTLNHCLEKSSGDFIARMDDDDLSYPERFEKQVKFLLENKKISFVSTSIDIFDGCKIVGQRLMKAFPSKLDFLWNSPFIHPATMFRRNDLVEVGGYRVAEETKRGQDYDLFMRMYAINRKGANLQDKLYRYTISQNTYKKRTMKARIGEYNIRKKGFIALGLMPFAAPFLLKPFIAQLYQYIHTRKG